MRVVIGKVGQRYRVWKSNFEKICIDVFNTRSESLSAWVFCEQLTNMFKFCPSFRMLLRDGILVGINAHFGSV